MPIDLPGHDDGTIHVSVLTEVDPVRLVYEYHPTNIFPHWMVMAPRMFNFEYYSDMFRTKAPFSERIAWLNSQIGPGSRSANTSHMWFAHELKHMAPAVCFRREQDALFFKLRWA